MDQGLHVIPVYRALTIVNSALRPDGIGGLVLVPVMTSTLSFPVEIRYDLPSCTDASTPAADAHSAPARTVERR